MHVVWNHKWLWSPMWLFAFSCGKENMEASLSLENNPVKKQSNLSEWLKTCGGIVGMRLFKRKRDSELYLGSYINILEQWAPNPYLWGRSSVLKKLSLCSVVLCAEVAYLANGSPQKLALGSCFHQEIQALCAYKGNRQAGSLPWGEVLNLLLPQTSSREFQTTSHPQKGFAMFCFVSLLFAIEITLMAWGTTLKTLNFSHKGKMCS